MNIKNKKLTERLTLSEKWHVCRRVLVEMRRMSPAFFPATLIRQLLEVSRGYLGIYVSSEVLSGLERGVPARSLIMKTGFMLGAIFVFSLLACWLQSYSNRVKDQVYDLLAGKMAVKSAQMDYPELDSPYLNQLKNRINEDNSWGNGIYGAYLCVEYLIYQFWNVCMAAAFLWPVASRIIQVENPLFWVFVAVLLFVLAANGLGESFFAERLVYYMQQEPGRPEDMDLTWDFVEGESGRADNLKDIKLYGARSLVYEYLCEHGKQFRDRKNENMSKADGINALVNNVLGAGVQGICYFFITLLAAGGNVSVGMIVRYVACFERIVTALQAIIRDLQGFLLVARRQATTMEYLDAAGSLYKGTLPVEKRNDDEYEIEFRDVSFRYPGSEVDALSHLSLKIRIGERMAVVGKNGSGKTTMIKLLSRLYDPTEGQILLNGIDIRKFDYCEYRKLFSIIFQDFSLFSFSIAQNVAASEEYDAEKVRGCLERAGFGERLAQLSDGIETVIDKEWEDNGILVSGGERQKIAIARALYKEAPFILLDEPTASLDPLAEFEVYSAFQEMVGSKTAIYISHRLSSCRFCNDIVVFDAGRIAQRGSHEQLMKEKRGLYYSLWSAQAEYYEKKR